MSFWIVCADAVLSFPHFQHDFDAWRNLFSDRQRKRIVDQRDELEAALLNLLAELEESYKVAIADVVKIVGNFSDERIVFCFVSIYRGEANYLSTAVLATARAPLLNQEARRCC